MINLEKRNSKRVNGYSSKGNVPKWKIGDKWYKLDVFGYEGLAEYIVSHLLKKTNVTDFVLYDLTEVLYKGKKISCISKNFMNKNEELVTVEKLHLAETGIGLAKKISLIKDLKDKIVYLVDFVESTTKNKNFHIDFTKMLELDMFFLNEDRHTNNIAFIRNRINGKYKSAPIFDNGLSLLSDISDYSIDIDVYKNLGKVKAKPFSADFIEQVEVVEKLYKQQLEIRFDKNDIEKCLESVKKFYPKEIIDRVRTIFYEQMRKYTYLIKE